MDKPIRVLHVFGKLHRGGAETMVMNLYRNIDRTKIQFDFVVHNEQEEAYESEIIDLGGIIYRVPQYKGYNHIQYVNTWKKLISDHPEHQIVHGHVRSTAAIYLKISSLFNRKTISHSHSTSNGEGISAVVKAILQYPIRYISDYFFAPSASAGKWLYGENIINSNRFYILKNAIDVINFKYNERTRETIRTELNFTNEFVVGHIGRFHVAKNHEFILEVFSKILQLTNEANLLLLGAGEEFEKIKKKTKEMGISEHVIFIGSTSKTAEYMQAMDVFIFPSFYEGLGIVAIEAQAAGLPTFVSENIPEEAYLTDIIFKLELSDAAQRWAFEILENAKTFKRKDTSDEIIKKGYDIVDNANWLETFYFKILNNY